MYSLGRESNGGGLSGDEWFVFLVGYGLRTFALFYGCIVLYPEVVMVLGVDEVCFRVEKCGCLGGEIICFFGTKYLKELVQIDAPLHGVLSAPLHLFETSNVLLLFFVQHVPVRSL